MHGRGRQWSLNSPGGLLGRRATSLQGHHTRRLNSGRNSFGQRCAVGWTARKTICPTKPLPPAKRVITFLAPGAHSRGAGRKEEKKETTSQMLEVEGANFLDARSDERGCAPVSRSFSLSEWPHEPVQSAIVSGVPAINVCFQWPEERERSSHWMFSLFFAV